MDSRYLFGFVLFLLAVFALVAETNEMIEYAPACSILANCKRGGDPLYILADNQRSKSDIKASIKRHIRGMENLIYWRIIFLASVLGTTLLVLVSRFFSVQLPTSYMILIFTMFFLITKSCMHYIHYHVILFHIYRIEDYSSMLV